MLLTSHLHSGLCLCVCWLLVATSPGVSGGEVIGHHQSLGHSWPALLLPRRGGSGAGARRHFAMPAPPPTQPCDGVCMPLATCLSLGGSPAQPCASLPPATSKAFCCQFETSCTTASQAETFHYHSPNYPAPVAGNLLCVHQVILTPGICGVRLEFLEFNTSAPLDRGLCHIDQLLIINSLDGAAFPRCGHLTSYATIVPVDARHRVPLILLNIIQSSKETFKWNIKVSQIRCEDTVRISDHPGCGANFESPNLIVSPTPPAVESDSDNSIEDIGFGKAVKPEFATRTSADNAFYIEYLKQSYQALVADGPAIDPNATYCKNNLNSSSAGASASPTLKQRIIRGSDAALYEFPWQVSIQDHKGHVCGGAILNAHFIVSASHCFLSVVPVVLSQMKVVLGDLNLNSTTETEHLVRSIQSVVFHSHFDPYFLTNDIALIRLRAPIPFRKGIQPICLPQQDNSYVGRVALISGWGATHYPQGKLATRLQRVENGVMENAECKRVLRTPNIYSTMMCALAPKCSGTCFGDSGGPLVVTDAGKGGSSRLIGIVSFGIGGCALLPYWPDVYTRVSEYIDWLSYATIT